MHQFQYHVLVLSLDQLTENGGQDASEQLTRLGSEGWDITTTIALSNERHLFILRKSS